MSTNAAIFKGLNIKMPVDVVSAYGTHISLI